MVVSVPTNNFQINPAVAVLNNSNVVVVWSSYDEAGSNSLQDVYGQMFSQTGQKIGGEFLMNQFTRYNQRTPAIAALAGGGFVVAWVSEQERRRSPSRRNQLRTASAGQQCSSQCGHLRAALRQQRPAAWRAVNFSSIRMPFLVRESRRGSRVRTAVSWWLGRARHH